MCLFSLQSLRACPTHHLLISFLIVVACFFCQTSPLLQFNSTFQWVLVWFYFFALFLAPPDLVHLSVKLGARLSTGTEVCSIFTILNCSSKSQSFLTTSATHDMLTNNNFSPPDMSTSAAQDIRTLPHIEVNTTSQRCHRSPPSFILWCQHTRQNGGWPPKLLKCQQ